MMNIVLIGAPGSGKGTQAFKLKELYNLVHVSTGDLFRNAIKNETKLGIKVKSILDSGSLVSDELTLSIVKEAIDNVENGFMLDGYPRTVVQAQMLEELGVNIDAVLYFEINKDLLIERLVGRRICKNCGASYHITLNRSKIDGICDLCGGELYQRADDNETSVIVRLNEFYDKTIPVIDYYKQQGKLYEIDASLELEVLTTCIEKIFKELK